MENKIFEELKTKSKNVDQAIEKLLPRNLDNWITSKLGEPKWDYDTKTCEEAIMKPMWDLLDRGGKRWRPFLMKLCHEASGGKSNIEKFLPIVEVIHNGTLMIDDIEDSSDLRRGKPCIHKIYGEDIAINAGNAMYYLPILSILKDTSLDNSSKVKIYEEINENMIKLSLGQGMDIFWHRGNGIPSKNEYLQMCAFKTGTLARMAAKLGAILGKADEKTINACGEFAESLGVAFQIQDDILNICPNENWGKEIGDDIKEGKRTLLVIQALETLDKENAKDLIGILNLKTKNEILIKEAIKIIKKSDTIKKANEIAKKIVQDAWEKLNEILPHGEAKTKLKMFSEFITERKI